MANKEQIAQERKWQTLDDARTIEQYAEVMSDKKRFNSATKLLQKKVTVTQKVLKDNKSTIKKNTKSKKR